MWGVNEYTNGVNPDYLELVINGILESVESATNALEPAFFRFGVDEDTALPLVGDTRNSQVFSGEVFQEENNNKIDAQGKALAMGSASFVHSWRMI